MAVENKKSTIVTNGDANPPALTDSYIHEGRVLKQAGIAAVAAADDDNSTYRLHRVPSNARISSLKIQHGVITGGSDFDLGAYETADNGGAVKDADILADGLDLSSARSVPTEVLGVGAGDTEKRLWELLGESEDPHRDYDIVLTANTVGSAAQNVRVEIEYQV